MRWFAIFVWCLRFARLVRRRSPDYPWRAALAWALASYNDALQEWAEFNEPVPTPEEAFSFEMSYATE